MDRLQNFAQGVPSGGLCLTHCANGADKHEDKVQAVCCAEKLQALIHRKWLVIWTAPT